MDCLILLFRTNAPDQGFLVVSFLVVSVVILVAAVSFLAVSTTVVLVESVTLVVSVVVVDPDPLQAAKNKAMNAANDNLLMFFISDI